MTIEQREATISDTEWDAARAYRGIARTIQNDPTMYSRDAAYATANALNESDPDWLYTVFYEHAGLYSVAVFDESDTFAGKWSAS